MATVVSVRGAANGLMAEVIEDHVRSIIGDPAHDARGRGPRRGTATTSAATPKR